MLTKDGHKAFALDRSGNASRALDGLDAHEGKARIEPMLQGAGNLAGLASPTAIEIYDYGS
jgi:hypothetical protein